MTCVSPLTGTTPGPDYRMDLCDVTTLAEVMALSYEVNNVGGGPGGANGYGNFWPAEVAGKRMVNAAGLTLVNDVTSANGARYLRLGSSPNVGEAGYGYSNLVTLFPADTYRNFCVQAIERNMEGGACLGGTIEFYTPDFFQGISIIRDPGSGEIKLTSYLNAETSGDFLTPLTGATLLTDIIHVSMHWVLTNRQDVFAGEAVTYDVAIDITVKVNGVASPTRSLTGSVEAARFESDALLGLAPWQFLTGQSFGDDASEIHGWGFSVGDCTGNAQLAGVTAYTHLLANGTLRTNVQAGGQPKGGYKRWKPLGQKKYPTLPINLPLPPPVGGGVALQSTTQSVTIAAAAFTDTIIQIPDDVVLISVSVLVTTTIPTATSFDVGIAGNTNKFNIAAVGTTAGSTDPGTKATGYNAAATAVRLTMNGGTPATNVGRVRVTINYLTSA